MNNRMIRPGSAFAILMMVLSNQACLVSPEKIDAAYMVDAGQESQDAGQTEAGDLQICKTEMTLDNVIDVAADASDTQIHVALAFDGRGVWLVYNLPDGNAGFDVYMTRLGCDGQVLTPAFRVNTSDANDTDPDIAIGDDAIYVVWAPDNGSSSNNMDVFYRVFNHDGSPRMASDRALETSYNGNPVEGNVMFPSLTALPAGGFAIAAQRGIPAAAGFQAFVQRLDDDGNLIGPAIDGYVEDGRYDNFSSMAARANGDIYLTYVRGEIDQDSEVVQVKIPANASVPEPQPPHVIARSNGDMSSFYAVSPDDDRIYLAYDYNSNITLMDGADMSGGASFIELGSGGGLDYSPRIVAGIDGGSVFWYRNISGFRNQFMGQSFHYDGSSFTLGTPRAVCNAEVPPYAPAAAHVDDDIYVIAWSEGVSPAFRIKMAFVNME